MNQYNYERKRWWIAVAAVAMQLCFGTVYAWSIFKKPMMAANGWSETQTQTAFMIYCTVFPLCVAIGGTLIDRIRPRIVGLAGGLMFGTGIILAGFANHLENLFLLYIVYGIIGAVGGGLGYVTPVATLIRWFPDKRGLVTGLAVMGYGAGSFIMGTFAPRIIINHGIATTFYLWGGLSIFIVLIAVMALENPPTEWIPSGFQPATGSISNVADSFTLTQAIKAPQWWLLWLIFLLTTSAGIGLISQLAPIAQEKMIAARAGAITAQQIQAIVIVSGTVVAAGAIFNGIGRLAWASLSDIIGRKSVFLLLFGTQAIGYMLLPQVTHILIFSVMACYLLACYGGILASMPAFAADDFGPAHIGKIYGMLFTACAVGGFFGPFLLAYIKEMTDSFTIALYIESGILMAGLLLTIVYRKPQLNMRSLS